MAELYQNLLVVICLALLGWGIIRIDRIYQYPFIMGIMFTTFILPQAYALVNNPGLAVSKIALERVLLMSCLCASATWIGYQLKPNIKLLTKFNTAVDERKLFRAGLILMALGLLFSFLLSRTSVQLTSNGTWAGPATIYYFFSQVINIALAIFLLQTLKHPNFINISCTVISAQPLISQLLLGRRQPTMTLAVIVGLSLWLVRRYTPPRGLVVAALLLLTVLIPVVGELRGDFWNLVFRGDWNEVLSATQKAFGTLQKGEILELRNAALLMDAAEKTNSYGYGTSWWNSIIFQYVPGQIVGYEFKESLQFKLIDPDSLSMLYGYEVPTGSTFTGIGDSFGEFSYLGSLIFALIANIFKSLWIGAVYHKNAFSQLLYMGLVSPAMVGLTHGMGRFWQEAIFQVFFAAWVVYYSRLKQYPYRNGTEVTDLGR